MTGWLDIAALVRQVLLIADVTYTGTASIAVPRGDAWPTVDQWNLVGCSAALIADGTLRIAAQEWAPPTSPFPDDSAADSRALTQVRETYRDAEPAFDNMLPADPFWKEAHRDFSHYRGEPQRQAARAAVLNDGGSLIVALPTGRGKTAVAWSKTMLSKNGVTIVVVPTVVLALDMERRTQEVAHELDRELSPVGRYAYVGSLDNESKKQLRTAVRSGKQRLIYTSPEALVSGLAPALLACAKAGFLQQIVIDEAHLVDQWGTDFRPEFQMMPGLIREAYATAPFGSKPAVLLLSATLAQRAVDVLTRLFQVGNRSVDLVWGSEVRTEPAFFFSSFQHEDGRIAAVLEAVSRLPRPLILYTSTVEDAETWTTRLRDAGLARVAGITGKSKENDRREVMARWRGERPDGTARPTEVDVVVGTSAFGLGLDMPNVRSVVHACLPETIDRYYQEIGRSGRDGRPSVAYLCQTPNDLVIARALNNVSLIGDERGWKRWRSMLSEAKPVGPFRYRTKKDTLPPYLDVGYKRHQLWNVRTLTLLAQAGVITLNTPRLELPLDQSDDQLESQITAFYDEVDQFIEFELRDGALQAQEPWKKALGELRTEVSSAQGLALQSLRDLTTGQVCVGRTIAQHYKVKFEGGLLITSPACRGCPACRRSPESSPGTHPVEPWPLLPTPEPSRDALAGARGGHGSIFIRYSVGDDLGPLLARMAQRHIRVWRADQSTVEQLQRDTNQVPIIRDDPQAVQQLVGMYDGPMAVVLTEPQIPSEVWGRIKAGLPTYLVAPEHTVHPERPGEWLLRDLMDPCIAAATFLKEI